MSLTAMFGYVLISMLIAMLMWTYIVELFRKVIIPALRKGLGNQVADAVATIFSWLDDPASIGRGAMLDAWRLFKLRVLGIKTTWKVERDTAVETTATKYLLPETGHEDEIKAMRRVPREQLPREIRAETIRMGTDVAELDMMEALKQRVKETAKKQEILLEGVC